MSTSSKYANLPGIALDQPDLYESNAESDKLPFRFKSPINLILENDFDENIKLIDVDAKKAFKVFEKSNIGGADFEELIGYQIPNFDQYQSSKSSNDKKDSSQELILEKYERLQKESSNLINHLKCIKLKSQPNQDFGQIVSPQVMANNLQTLQLQLKNKINEDFLVENKDVVDFVKVTDLLNSLEPKVKLKNSVLSQVASQKPLLLTQLDPINLLEKKLDHLEKLINCEQDKINFINSYTNSNNLTEAINTLNIRVALLNINNLEQIDGRVTSLLFKLSKTIDKKDDSEVDAQRLNKINQLYENFSNAEKNMSTVCDLTSRLNISTKNQEEVLKFAENLWNLDNLQSKLESDVKSKQQQLKLLQESFDLMMKNINSILININERINALTK